MWSLSDRLAGPASSLASACGAVGGPDGGGDAGLPGSGPRSDRPEDDSGVAWLADGVATAGLREGVTVGCGATASQRSVRWRESAARGRPAWCRPLDRVTDRQRLRSVDTQAVDERAVGRPEVLDCTKTAAVQADARVRAGDLRRRRRAFPRRRRGADQQFVVEQNRHADRPPSHHLQARHSLAHALNVPRGPGQARTVSQVAASAAIGRLRALWHGCV